MTEYDNSKWQCPEAVNHVSDRSGRCRWCGRKVDAAIPRPRNTLFGDEITILDLCYGLYWDPDFPYQDKHYDA